MLKENVKSLIWKCFECELDFSDNKDGDFVWYAIFPSIRLRFFNLVDYENYNGCTDTFGWGILLEDSTPLRCLTEDADPDETMFYIYDYFDGTPADLFRNIDKVIDGMAEDISEEIKKSMRKRNEFVVNA